ncbi:asparaginyl-tRNA synthetase [Blumeria hordei DH14]|uniref:asparagine--tRNA ligase n=1 Tax=Blumeria graminis f. sp. hordei (strain DH14) TaxID=546991 RepID=N1JAH0_BLUG1|nr:asparaginyl-tRNA synthetase [Blumeria hordei DH14]
MAISNPSETRNSDPLQQSGMVQACRLCRPYSRQSRPEGVVPPLASVSYGCAVRLTGSWKPSLKPSIQSHELHVSRLDLVGPTNTSYPLQKKYQSPEYLRTMPHLRSRIPFNAALLRFRSDAIAIVTKTLSEMAFVQTHTPIITSSDCEGAGEVFHVSTASKGKPRGPEDDFFRSPKYLTVSSQLHLEALSQSVGKVWTLSPSFRAERSDTTRHLSEFYQLEAEMSFVESMDDVMHLIRSILTPIARSLGTSQTGQDLLYASDQKEELRGRWHGITLDWKRITYTEAIKNLQASTHIFEHEPKWAAGLQTEHEKYIAQMVGVNARHVTPVFVTHYPRLLKPFYMLSSAESEVEGETVDCFDLLVPDFCEIAGGSMREHRLQPLLAAMLQRKLIPSLEPSDDQLRDLKWYVDLRKWGSVPHGGFGLGFDRILGYMAGVPHVREMVTFPRWVGRCDC